MITALKVARASDGTFCTGALSQAQFCTPQFELLQEIAAQGSKNLVPLSRKRAAIEYSPGDLRSFLELLSGPEKQAEFERVAVSIVNRLARLQAQGVDLDTVDMSPDRIFYSPQTFEAAFIVFPVTGADPTPFHLFFEQLFALVESKGFALEEQCVKQIREHFSSKGEQFDFQQISEQLRPADPPTIAFNPGLGSSPSAPEPEDPGPNPFAPREPYASLADRKTPSLEALPVGPLPQKSKPTTAFAGTNLYQGTELYIEPEKSAQFGFLTNLATGETVAINQVPFTIGRSADFASLAIDNPRISSVHARIVEEGRGLQILDLNSTNAVRLNEEKIPPQTPVALTDQVTIRMADVSLKFSAQVAS